MSRYHGNGRTINVAHVTWGLDVGGMEKLLVEFARHRDKDRFRLHFVSLKERGPLAGEIERLGSEVIALDRPEGLRPDLVPLLRSLFRRRRIDVVHTHNSRALFYGAPAARWAGVERVIHTWHGIDTADTAKQRVVLRMLSQLVDTMVAVSEEAAGLMRSRGVPRSKVAVIHNGIDIARFAFSGPALQQRLVCVARLRPEKDLGTLLRAAGILAERNVDFELHIAGDGECRQELERLAGDLNLSTRVRFAGLIQDVANFLRQGRVFVLSSLTEGISLTLLEAMAVGLPVVATAVGGNSEVVDDGVTGLLVPSRDPEALADALGRLLADADLCRRMGAAGRTRVEERFDIRRMVRQYEALYLGAKPARAQV